MLLWSLFVPTGAVWSADSQGSTGLRKAFTQFRLACHSSPNIDYSHLSSGSVALLGQTVVMYLVTAHLKIGPEWTENYHALYLTLCVNQWVTPLGVALREAADSYPLVFQALRALTALTPPMQQASILLLSPFWTAHVRISMVTIFAAFQFGLGCMLRLLCVFPEVTIAGSLCFLPSLFWDTIFPPSNQQSTPRKEAALEPRTHSIKGSGTLRNRRNPHQQNVDTAPDCVSERSVKLLRSETSLLANLVCVLLILFHSVCLLEFLRLVPATPTQQVL